MWIIGHWVHIKEYIDSGDMNWVLPLKPQSQNNNKNNKNNAIWR